MTGFFALSVFAQSAVQILLILIVLAEIYCLIICLIYKTEKADTFFNVLLFAVSLACLIVLSDGFRHKEVGVATLPIIEALCGLPSAIIFVLLVFQASAVCFAVYRVNFRRKTKISPMSIKQGADRLTTGICCYDENGRPKLVNHSMERLCRSITGEPLLNASDFWKKLSGGEVMPGNTVIKSGSEPIILLESGEVRCFSRKEIISGKKPVFELSASDITEQYALSRRLMENNAELEAIKKRLILFSENVSDITREREILAAKVSIHDRLGNTLIAARRYIETGEEAISRKTLLDMFNSNIALLRREAEQPPEDEALDSLYEAAQIMGITLTVEGDLPKNDNRAMRLVMCAARECITNAVRHAGATVLTIVAFSDRDGYTVEYKNNGTPPEDEITEGGGLSSLRKSVEDEGGKMEIVGTPQFVLRLKISKQRRRYDG